MRRFILLGVVAISQLATASAHAAFFLIDDTLPTEEIVFSANDFEGGLTINGVNFQQGINNPAVAKFPEGDAAGNAIQYNFSGQWIIQGQTPPQPIEVWFVEPTIPGAGGPIILSDILRANYDRAGDFGFINGSFISFTTDANIVDPAQIPPGVVLWPETNGPFNFSAPFLTATAISDVPEPGSLVLLGIGIMGMVGYGWRKRKMASCK